MTPDSRIGRYASRYLSANSRVMSERPLRCSPAWLLIAVVTPLLSAGRLPAEELHFFAVAPCRLVDTRPGTQAVHSGGGALQHGVPRTWQIAGHCGIPATAGAVSLT